jgi:hypothetical protein
MGNAMRNILVILSITALIFLTTAGCRKAEVKIERETSSVDDVEIELKYRKTYERRQAEAERKKEIRARDEGVKTQEETLISIAKQEKRLKAWERKKMLYEIKKLHEEGLAADRRIAAQNRAAARDAGRNQALARTNLEMKKFQAAEEDKLKRKMRAVRLQREAKHLRADSEDRRTLKMLHDIYGPGSKDYIAARFLNGEIMVPIDSRTPLEKRKYYQIVVGIRIVPNPNEEERKAKPEVPRYTFNGRVIKNLERMKRLMRQYEKLIVKVMGGLMPDEEEDFVGFEGLREDFNFTEEELNIMREAHHLPQVVVVARGHVPQKHFNEIIAVSRKADIKDVVLPEEIIPK